MERPWPPGDTALLAPPRGPHPHPGRRTEPPAAPETEQVEGNRPLFGSNFTIKSREMGANEVQMRCFKGQETMQHGYAQGNSVKKERKRAYRERKLQEYSLQGVRRPSCKLRIA